MQDPFLELWKHGSRVTYIVALFAFLPAFFNAISSACGLPVEIVTAFDIIWLFLQIKQPTLGLGNVLP